MDHVEKFVALHGSGAELDPDRSSSSECVVGDVGVRLAPRALEMGTIDAPALSGGGEMDISDFPAFLSKSDASDPGGVGDGGGDGGLTGIGGGVMLPLCFGDGGGDGGAITSCCNANCCGGACSSSFGDGGASTCAAL